MTFLFTKETFHNSTQFQSKTKLKELDKHELLKKDQGSDQIATFDQIKDIGLWFLSQTFNSVLPSSQPLPQSLLKMHELRNGGAFWGKLALGADAESQFPVTLETVQTPQGRDLRLHIVPIHFGALEVASFTAHTEGLLALSAAAAVAPHFMLALESGVTTQHCATKKDIVTAITPDHGTPLAVTFDAFDHHHQTLQTVTSVVGKKNLTIKEAAHLHGQSQPSAHHITRAAAGSKIAAGVPVLTLLRRELPKHVLFIQTTIDEVGRPRIKTIQDSLTQSLSHLPDLSLLAAALGFTARVVGDSAREKTIERVLQPSHADVPLVELLK